MRVVKAMALINFVVALISTQSLAHYAHGHLLERRSVVKPKLHKLSLEEEQFIFGPGASSVPEYDVISAPSSSSSFIRRKRFADSLDQHNVSFQALGRRFNVTLHPSPTFISPYFALVLQNGSRNEILQDIHTAEDCLYQGTVTYGSRGRRKYPAALDLCDGMRGILGSNGEYYVIQPLPGQRRRKRDVHNHNHIRHVVYRKVAQEIPCPKAEVHVSTPTEPLMRRTLPEFAALNVSSTKWRRPNRTRVTRSEREYAIETAVFVDRDLYRHMATVYPVDTEQEITRFVLAMINAVQLLYRDDSLGNAVHFVLKRLEILTTSDPVTPGWTLTQEPDIDQYLSEFCLWQRDKNPGLDGDPLHWDHALLLTGLDLFAIDKQGRLSDQVVGLAPVAGMCTRTSSCTINEGRHFESVYVVAHEIGHNLGMRHDGASANNDCDPGGYIMSPTLGSGKTTWSPCSRRYLQTFLDSPQAQCLSEGFTGPAHLDHNAEGLLPGERFDANQQCVLKHGKDSAHSNSRQVLSEICRDLHCRKQHGTWTSHPALEGTTCGPSMWCRRGRCTEKAKAPAPFTQTGLSVPLAHAQWGTWSSYGDCASGCLYGSDGLLSTGSTGLMSGRRKCYDERGEISAKCVGGEFRYQTCNAVKECTRVRKITIQDYADQVCDRAARFDNSLNGKGTQQASHDPLRSCQVWCYKKTGGSVSYGWSFPDGTACSTLRHTPSFCVAGTCQEFQCDSQSRFQLANDYCYGTYPANSASGSVPSSQGAGMGGGSGGVLMQVSNYLDSRISIYEKDPDIIVFSSTAYEPYEPAFPMMANRIAIIDDNLPTVTVPSSVTPTRKSRPKNMQMISTALPTTSITKSMQTMRENEETSDKRNVLLAAHAVSRYPWSQWMPVSGCRRNCVENSVGFRLVSRQCQEKSEEECYGNASGVQICENQPSCTKFSTPDEWATEKCQQLLSRLEGVITGRGVQLMDDRDRNCRIACQLRNPHSRLQYHFPAGEDYWFPFGTACLGGYCVSGKCTPVISAMS